MKKNKMMSGIAPLIKRVRTLVLSARRTAVSAVNTLQVRTNFEVGRLIVEHEQRGHRRAGYGDVLIGTLAKQLTLEFGQGFSKRNLEYMRRFYTMYRSHFSQIAQKPSAQFTPLSWSHYVILMGIQDNRERRFYEIEAAQSGWSTPEFKRQLKSGLFERLALSRNKESIRRLAAKGQVVEKPQDILKSPLVLEFLGMEEKTGYSESDLETAIINKLQHFLLELGKGFLFEARQKRFTFDEDHYFVDLVFYNRLLRCYVLVDLKLDKLTHQDLGQMQMYVNYFDRHVKTSSENPTIGILLSKRKKDALIKLTLPKNANIFASRYQLYLPSKEELGKHLIEWTSRLPSKKEKYP